MTVFPEDPCNAPLHPQAAQGLRLFNLGRYFEAHEALEEAWNAERGQARDLYRGILQIAVAYLHIIRKNYNGAIKVYERSEKWMRDWPEVCRGIQVGQLRRDAEAVIRVLLSGSDVIGQAGTGTGKTAAFALPLLHRLFTDKRAGKEAGVRALVLVPTRELAMQVAEAIHKYAKKTALTVVPCYGGAPMDQQIRALHRGADIVVATPGRALDHLRRGSMSLEALEVLVLDEADEMLDMGFAEDLEAILAATPESRQTALFAATMAPRIASIAERHLKKPVRIQIKAEKRAPGKLPRVRQVAYIVSRAQKSPALGRILEFEDPVSVMVFCRTRVEVDELTDTLKSHGYGEQALHGGMERETPPGTRILEDRGEGA